MDMTDKLQRAKLFSVQTDDSTDVANSKQEQFLALYCDPHGHGRKLPGRSAFIAVLQTKVIDATGFFTALFAQWSIVECKTGRAN